MSSTNFNVTDKAAATADALTSHASSTSNPHSTTAAQVGLGNVTNTSDANKPVSTAQQTALDLKANLASPTFTGTVAGVTAAMVGLGSVDNTADTAKPVSTAQQTALNLKANIASPTFTGTVGGVTAAMVGLGNVTNTSDASKPVSTAQQTALDLKANLASPTFTGTPTLPTGTVATTQAAGNNTTAVATTAFVTAINNNASYRTILQAASSHIAARVAGTYALANGEAAAISGTGTLYPLAVIQIASADYPTINGITPKLRIRAQLFTNDVAPTGNYTFGLYPITRPGTSGGSGLNIFTLGTVVSGSNGASFTAPAADLLGSAVGADFALPADGPYVIGVVTTATVAASSLVHLHAQLQMRNT